MRPAKIVTFYSYKGGVGRSMAVANTAWILASAGKNVLVVDWDLESPGLHRFFAPLMDPGALEATKGVVDMVSGYAFAARSAPDDAALSWALNKYADVSQPCFPLDWNQPGWGTLHFLSAGQQNDAYVNNVASLRWSDIVERQSGEAFFEAMRESMRSADFDYVLVDSRTGLGDHASVCTTLLPDVLVVGFTMSTQSIEGSADLAVGIAYDDGLPRRIRVIPVPMRIENGEAEKLANALWFAKGQFRGLPAGLSDEDREEYWRQVRVSNIPYFTYEESLAGVVPNEELLGQYERLVLEITEGEVSRYHRLPEAKRRALAAKFERHPAKVSPVGSVAVAAAPSVRRWSDWIRTELGRAGVRTTAVSATSTVDALSNETVLVVLSDDLTYQPVTRLLRDLVVRSFDSKTNKVSGMLAARVGGDPDAPVPYPFNELDRVISFDGLTAQEARSRLLEAFGQPVLAGRTAPTAAAEGTRFPGTIPKIYEYRPANPRFVGRWVSHLEGMRSLLGFGANAQARTLVLSGQSGFGKTQIALKYVSWYAFDYDVVWWVRARDAGEARRDLRRFAAAVAAEFRDDRPGGEPKTEKTDLDGADDPEVAALERLRRGNFGSRWLLVYDNVTDPISLGPLFVSGTATGHVIVTSTLDDAEWSDEYHVQRVREFTLSESLALIHNAEKSIDDQSARRIAEKFGNVPRLVDQAVRYVERFGGQSSEAVDDYIKMHESELRKLVSTRTPGPAAPRSSSMIMAGWALGVRELGDRRPMARRLLELCTFLAPDGAPIALLRSPGAIEVLGEQDAEIRQTQTTMRLITAITGAGLAYMDRDSSTIHVNRTVRDVVQAIMQEEGKLEQRRSEAIRILASYAPLVAVATTSDGHAALAELSRHVEPSGVLTSAESTSHHSTEEPATAGDYDEAVRRWLVLHVWYLTSAHRPADAHAVGSVLMERWERDSPDRERDFYRLWMGRQVANARRALSDYVGAANLDEEVYRLQRETLGPQHPNTLSTARNIGADLRARGRFKDAVVNDEATYVECEQALGSDHPDTLTIAHNLAQSLYLAGSLTKALDRARETLELCERVFGKEDPATWDAALSVGIFERQSGQVEAATDIFQAASRSFKASLTERARVARLTAVAARRPDDLGYSIRDGRFAYQTLLEASEFGPDDDETMASAMSLATTLSMAGQHDEAVELGRAQLARYHEKFAGLGMAEHPFYWFCAVNLSVYLRRAGEHAEALTLNKQALDALLTDDQIQPENFFIFAAAVNHANCLVDSGDVAGALYVDEMVNAQFGRFYPPTYPDALTAATNLADSRRRVDGWGSADQGAAVERVDLPIEMPLL